MPNHITNILNVDDLGGVSLQDARSAFIGEDGNVDFDTIIPSPECLRGFEPCEGGVGRAKAALGLVENPDQATGDELSALTARLGFSNRVRDIYTPADQRVVRELLRCIENYQKCGYMYWYDWNLDHWGTKWGAYGQPEGGQSNNAKKFQFQTAWSHPGKIIKALSDRLPSVTFSIWYADEDIGSNCGRYVIKGGHRSSEDLSPPYDQQTEEQRRYWTETAFRIVEGEDAIPARFGYDKNWQYSEEVYEKNQSAES